ncbi:Proton-dependent Oligopeptide transporter (POT) Family [Phytophthora palmivora]|uniref:Proton-dependent Oligopeptide transporter (POT) Family n=1 Tax=Phytophthora palmivora TaxID=4796 RepID=A0A2P4X7D3_9STRA|nr:Proton-dependent Oligopeptide transporter (POT) Family [Phytophthora palmivora]
MVAAGYVVAIIAMVWTGVFEIVRRNSPLLTYVDANGEMQYIYNNNGGQPMSDIRWYNAIPQYVLVAAATVLIQIPTYNIAYTEDIPANLNDGHMENMYFTIAGVMAVNGIFYVIVMNKMQFAMIPRLGKEPGGN